MGVAPQLLCNREKTLLVDALKCSYTLAELLAELDLARSSYFYHCARLKGPDKYADARIAIADVFQSNHRGLRLQANERSTQQTPVALLRESRAAPDETGTAARHG